MDKSKYPFFGLQRTRRQFLRDSALAGAGAAAGLTLPSPLAGTGRAATLEGPLNAFTWGGRIMQSEVVDFQ
jgi:hypothetical protein